VGRNYIEQGKVRPLKANQVFLPEWATMVISLGRIAERDSPGGTGRLVIAIQDLVEERQPFLGELVAALAFLLCRYLGLLKKTDPKLLEMARELVAKLDQN